MIKFTADGRKGKYLFIGLSRRNIELLQANRPVRIDGASMGLSHHICIFTGEDEQSMFKMLIDRGLDSTVSINEHYDDERQEQGEPDGTTTTDRDRD